MSEKKKKKGPRSRTERLAYAASLKRGKCLELLRPLSECTPAELGLADIDSPVSKNEISEMTVGNLCESLNIDISQLTYKLVRHTEGMRDAADVRQVMIEGDILGAVIPVRCSPAISRVVTKTFGFVTESDKPTEAKEVVAKEPSEQHAAEPKPETE